MDSGSYAAYSGLLARTEALDAAASNLSNASTNGFRAERDYFKGAITGEDALESQMGTALNSFGILGGTRVDTAQGKLASTGNPLDLAITGTGFFAVATPGGIRYTRDGSLQRGSDGLLKTQSGDPVLNSAGQPVPLPEGEIAVGDDGAISVNGDVAGQIGLFDLPGAALTPEGNGLYKNLGSTPRLSAGSQVRQRYLESSNQDVMQGTLQLLLVQRQAEMMQKALSLFETGFDKPASEELPRA